MTAEAGERRILHVIFDLKKAHSEYPMILTLGDNDPLGYADVEMDTVKAMALEVGGFIDSVVLPVTVHRRKRRPGSMKLPAF